MPEVVKLYKNSRDKELQHMLYKTKEGLQKEAFDYRDSYLSEHEYETVFAIYDEDSNTLQFSFIISCIITAQSGSSLISFLK